MSQGPIEADFTKAPATGRRPRPLPPSDAAAIDLHTELRTTLALASGTAAKFFELLHPEADIPRLVLALYSEYVAATDRVFRRFMDPRERRNRKFQPKRPIRKGSIQSDIP